MSANFRDIPANFRDIPANFRDICVSFFVSTRNMLQTCFQLLWEFSSGISPNFLGLPFSYLQPRLPFSYYVMERAAKACEEPENTWNDQKLRYFKFSSLSHPGSSKSRFCWISLFFLALRAPQVNPIWISLGTLDSSSISYKGNFTNTYVVYKMDGSSMITCPNISKNFAFLKYLKIP